MKEKPTLLEDVFRAYYDARKNKRNTKSQLAFEIDLEKNLIELYEDIRDRTYFPSPSVCFMVFKPVKREIFASQFRDRVVHHLLYNYVAPLFERKMIYDSYSCRKGKGTKFGIQRLDHHIRSCSRNYTLDAYVLKLDLRGYFMNIDKQRLYDIVADGLERQWSKRTKDGMRVGDSMDRELILFLAETIIFKDPTRDCIIRGNLGSWDDLPPSKSLIKSNRGKGLPIGDLTSQLFSNVYMGVFDDYVKRELRIKHYGRYVDDFFFVHESKAFLVNLIGVCRKYIMENLGIEVHPNKIFLQHYAKGVKFLGAVVKPHRIYVDNRCVREFRSCVHNIERWCVRDNVSHGVYDKCRARLNSYCGYLSQFRSYNILHSRFDHTPIKLRFDFAQGYKKVDLRPEYKPTLRQRTDKDARLGAILSRHEK